MIEQILLTKEEELIDQYFQKVKEQEIVLKAEEKEQKRILRESGRDDPKQVIKCIKTFDLEGLRGDFRQLVTTLNNIGFNQKVIDTIYDELIRIGR